MIQKITEESLETFLNLIKLRHNENHFQRIPLEVEQELIDKIRQGKYRDIHISAFHKMDDNLGLMAQDKITGYRYLVVASVTLFSRAAIESGISPDDAFDLSDSLLYSLSYCKTPEKIHQIFQLSATMFAKRVHKLRKNTRSYQTERICNYISRNIFNKITLEELSNYMEMKCTSLCHLFSQEMGITIHNYIQREKVDIACNLLSHTNRPVSEIATYLAFQTPSNFATVFRKWKHMTPSQYRAHNYKEVY